MEPEGKDTGVVFPLTEGRRSTSALGRAVLADAVRGVDPVLAGEILAGGDWRRGYIRVFRELTERYLASPTAAYTIAHRGLESAHNRFRFVRGTEEWTLAEAAASQPIAHELKTAVVHGDPSSRERALSVPYRGRLLTGQDLRTQLDSWVAAGVVEPSFADAIGSVIAHPEWLDLRDVSVLVLGAGAEMGPFRSLLRWGAHVVAVDLPKKQIWVRLLREARRSAGRLSFPVAASNPDGLADSEIAGAAGVDIVRDLAELSAWSSSFTEPLTIGNYMYADGQQHLLAAVAADALMAAHLRSRKDVSLAFLSTPTDVFAVPSEVVAESRGRGTTANRSHALLRHASGGRLFSPNYDRLLPYAAGEVGLCDSLVPVQGPNYALAKRIQRWRAMVSRAESRIVSHNVAPASRTNSVIKNRLLAAAYAGAQRFGVEIFDPPTSNTLMAALLVYDLRNPVTPASPTHNAVELFWQGAAHGGIWRIPYAPRSVLSIAVGLGLLGGRRNGAGTDAGDGSAAAAGPDK